jgi:phosphopantothenoylcysteine decarboxylase/phosphopantothenate--cysteine ligase
MLLKDKHILLGIGGGIAVYRAAELARLLMREGATVRCVMTKAAREFVTPLTFEALTGEQVHTELFDLTSEREMGHIKLARWADAVIIAPATANLLARFAHGIADDLLTTLFQVCEAPLLIAPAMNGSMWGSDATQRNVAMLASDRIHWIGPDEGDLACGESGPGRLAAPESILDALLPLVYPKPLAGQRWVINAGPTVEGWDAVRTLSNRASGSLGAHLARRAALLGANVTLIAGPGTPATPELIERIAVDSAAEMLSASQKHAAGADLFIATAAVSDYRFAEQLPGKLKRQGQDSLSVELIQNPDIVADIAAMKERPGLVIAFAAETDDHIEAARSKLVRKGVDAIIANDAANMGSDRAAGSWIDPVATRDIPACPKQQFAAIIIDHIMELQHDH